MSGGPVEQLVSGRSHGRLFYVGNLYIREHGAGDILHLD
jgi:hypothetical protein